MVTALHVFLEGFSEKASAELIIVRMELWFVDDARQRTPSRDQMGPICAAGGICVDETRLKSLEITLDEICRHTGFPPTQEFKWSPGIELWMRTNLVADARTNFYLEIVECAREHGVVGILASIDTNFKPVTGAPNHEMDVVHLVLERIHHQTPPNQSALVVADTPSGGNIHMNDRFVSDCLETLRTGTSALNTLDRICMVLTCSSHLNRCLQLADVFTSCLTAYLSGETRWSPPVATALRALLRTEYGRIGGCGVKIHPDYRYANLYHWLFGDEIIVKSNVGKPLPLLSRPYKHDPNSYWG
jgi:hypothetical protein